VSDIKPDNISSSPEQNTVALFTQAAPSPSTTPRIKKPRRNIFIIGALVIGVCICIGIGGIAYGPVIFKTITEKPKVVRIIDEFMSAIVDEDAGKAYALFSTRSKRNTSLADVEKMLEGNNYILLGYQNVTVTDLDLKTVFSTNPDMPEGNVAYVRGVIWGDIGLTGSFSAVLEQEGENWRLFSVDISADPDEFAPDQGLVNRGGR
jgi:hypothetical protein